ncbi:hypothetical protein BKA67DRAFT_281772 [Truncatella angustata]|uniref:Uncharacterized protein n=1 Tax=Truncatella angustata TaxID=152316 RepID=A0A9P8ZZ06_9PEZI|nr:uncharacterized protein BKA67DRAFT_281772 [Truncatella angustata]KAH6654530.1 hypothetical protein BKA67DRAFT_281772 [Truncatella angustata]
MPIVRFMSSNATPWLILGQLATLRTLRSASARCMSRAMITPHELLSSTQARTDPRVLHARLSCRINHSWRS